MGNPLADALRERGILIGRVRAALTWGKFFQLDERPGGVDPAKFIEIIRHIAAEQDFPRHRGDSGVHARVHQNSGRAVGRQRIVIAWSLVQLIKSTLCNQENPAEVLSGPRVR